MLIFLYLDSKLELLMGVRVKKYSVLFQNDRRIAYINMFAYLCIGDGEEAGKVGPEGGIGGGPVEPPNEQPSPLLLR